MNANDSTLACTIGLDLGTTALKGVLLASDGRVLHTAERPVHYRYPAPERVELEAQAHWLAVAGLIRELAGVAPGPVRALAMAGASGNTLLTDAGGAAPDPDHQLDGPALRRASSLRARRPDRGGTAARDRLAMSGLFPSRAPGLAAGA